jgi:hypothetical protein
MSLRGMRCNTITYEREVCQSMEVFLRVVIFPGIDTNLMPQMSRHHSVETPPTASV